MRFSVVSHRHRGKNCLDPVVGVSSNFNLTLTKFAKPSPSAATAGHLPLRSAAVACVGWEWRTAYPMLRSAELTFRDIATVARMRAWRPRPHPHCHPLQRRAVVPGPGLGRRSHARSRARPRFDPQLYRQPQVAEDRAGRAGRQAQMEPVAVASAAPSGPDVRIKTAAVHDNVRAPAQQAAALKSVPLPRVKPRAMMAAVPLPRERMVAKAPELRRRSLWLQLKRRPSRA